MVVDESAPEGTETVGGEPAEGEASAEVMKLLSEHVPLALLADLALPSGPESPQILQEEGLPDVAWWESQDEPEEPARASDSGD
ncbi:hypothetical protein N869_07765 [Cellulomonas bogoriensis 69B4 = DSM 16987]|uniref:Uncharacterized protein n=1 Tax=Cellulomonas bogoriensis 69B4 = DSM 16987 TaxID=1386082 RepID=A0A0A0C177_9CELL|nr:hypothetical protein [Cellulomonas bogoriensis]KGM13940.1 hypothetical protein N869_07765 [Cellulomonas bogoriensis 69B4 = DSM 16987]